MPKIRKILCNSKIIILHSIFSAIKVAVGLSQQLSVLEVSPNFNFPQDWGIEGVEKGILQEAPQKDL